MTMLRDGEPLDYVFSSPEEVTLAEASGELHLQQPVYAMLPDYEKGGKVKTLISAGRVLLNYLLPESMRWVNAAQDKKSLAKLVSTCYAKHGHERTIQLLDELKTLGFAYASRAGITMSMTDMDSPEKRSQIIRETEEAVAVQQKFYDTGRITQSERKGKVQELWMRASEQVADAIMEDLDKRNPIYAITNSGARGSTKQITQLAGMRGLMSDPFGNLIEISHQSTLRGCRPGVFYLTTARTGPCRHRAGRRTRISDRRLVDGRTSSFAD